MPANGPFGGTSFENMSHEQMLAWLDQANSGEVQAATDRLIAAAKAIREIADELKVRPQWVAWKGEGADAFRTWSADLANSTLRLGDFSEDGAKWLTEASGAIAQAQASIPRDTGSAQENLAAAKAAHNDPDAAAVAAKSARELAALEAHQEDVRQQAAAQMRKLGQTYTWSATQMNALERPRFPPLPEAIVPPEREQVRTEVATYEAGATASGTMRSGVVAPVDMAQGRGASSGASDARRSVELPSLGQPAAPTIAPGPRMDLDSLNTLPQHPHTPTDTFGGPPVPDQMRRETPSQPGIVPPAFRNNRGDSSAQGPGRAVTGSTGPVRAVTGSPRPGVPAGSGPTGPGQTAAAGRPPLPTGRGVSAQGSARMPSGGTNGIVGGRPVTPPAGRPTRSIPRGVVVGGESTPARGPLGPSAGTANSTGRMVGQAGQAAGRRLPSTSSAVVGGRPLTHNGVVGDNPRQRGRSGARRPELSSPATGGTAPARGGITGGATSAARLGESVSTGTRRAPQPTSPPNTEKSGGQPQRAAEGPEARQQNRQRTVPPVADGRIPT